MHGQFDLGWGDEFEGHLLGEKLANQPVHVLVGTALGNHRWAQINRELIGDGAPSGASRMTLLAFLLTAQGEKRVPPLRLSA